MFPLTLTTVLAAAVPYVRRDAVVLPVIDPTDRAEIELMLDAVDGVIVTGGCDVEPPRYGADADPETGPPAPLRERVALALCPALVERGQTPPPVYRRVHSTNRPARRPGLLAGSPVRRRQYGPQLGRLLASRPSPGACEAS